MRRLLFAMMLAIIFCGCKKGKNELDELWDYYKSNVQCQISVNHSLKYESIQVNIDDVICGKRANCLTDETLSGFVKDLVDNKIVDLMDYKNPETFKDRLGKSMVPNAIRMLKVLYEYEAERGSSFVSPYDYKSNVHDKVNFVSVNYRILPSVDYYHAVYVYDFDDKYNCIAYYDSYYGEGYDECLSAMQQLLEWYAWYKEKQEFGEDYETTIFKFKKEFQQDSLW